MPHLAVTRRPVVSLLVIVAAVATYVVMRYALERSATSTLAVPSRDNAHVSLASDGGSHVVVVWAATGAGGTDIYAAVSDDGGRQYSAPVRVNHTAGEA